MNKRLNRTAMRTYKVKLQFESPEVHDFWVEKLHTVRDCYNYASKIAFDEKLDLGIKQYHRRLYRELREKFPSLPSQMCVKTEQAVLAAYRTVRSNEAQIESPVVMKNAALQLDKRLFSKLTRTSMMLSNGNGTKRSPVRFLTYPKFNELASRYRMCDPKLQLHEKSGIIFACIPFLDLDTTPLEPEYMGIDLGCRRLATLSTGKAFADRKYLANRRRIRHNKRKLQARKKKSHSARRKLLRLRRKETNVSKQMCHALANRILGKNHNKYLEKYKK